MRFHVADGHCDFLYGMVERGYDLRKPKADQAIRLRDMQEGGVALQLFAAWTDMALRVPPLHQCLAMLDAYERMLDSNEELRTAEGSQRCSRSKGARPLKEAMQCCERSTAWACAR